MDATLSTAPHRIDVLDGWRAISVGLVVASHLVGMSGLRVYFGQSVQSIAINYGQIGVEFFFAISGFVICAGLLREDRVSLSGFYIRRAFRILPPLLIYVTVVGAMTTAGFVQVSTGSFVRALSFTCNIGPCDWQFGHTWSLAYEEQFYLVFPLIFIWLGAFRGKGSLLIGGAMAALLLLLYWHRSPTGIAGLRHFYSITCGVVAAMFADRVFAALRRVPWPLIVLAALLPFIVQLGPWNARLIVRPSGSMVWHWLHSDSWSGSSSRW